MTRFLSLLFALFLLITPVFAHSGRTDSNGGHYDRSTGEYHYHHGYSAHQHYDMDGDGIPDCPYNFKDTTNHSSGSSSSYSYTTGPTTITTAPATFATVPTTSSPRTTTAPQTTTTEKKEGKSGMIGWIVSLALVIALYGCSKSHQRANDIEQDRMRKKDKEIQALKQSLEAKDKALADLDAEMTIKIASLIEENANREKAIRAERSKEADSYEEELRDKDRTCTALRMQLQTVQKDLAAAQEKLNAIYAVSEPSEGQTPEEHAVALALKVSELEDHIQELSYELDKHVKREKVPSNVFFADDGLPVLLKSANKKYGDYTAYLSVKSGVYHLDPSCAPAHAYTVHLFNVPSTYRACSRCALGLSHTPPDWYSRLR